MKHVNYSARIQTVHYLRRKVDQDVSLRVDYAQAFEPD